MRLSIVIVTLNDKGILNVCLSSLLKYINFNKDEIIVVDNGSIDNTEKMIRTLSSQIKYYRSEKNIGVGPARNLGIMSAKGNYIMILDNDTRFSQLLSDIGSIVEGIFLNNYNIGLFSFRLLNNDGTHQNNARRFPSIIQPLLSRCNILLRFKFLEKLNRDHNYDDIDFSKDTIYDIDYAIGANHIFKKEIINYVGLYDENIFFGPEDCDFCLRIKRSGKRVCIASNVTIYHTYQRRSRKLNRILFKHIYGFLYLFWKERTFKHIHV
jgi:GT2 family glycosyltransferase